MPPVAPEPVDQPQARRDELRVGRVADPLQELESPVAVLAQLIERRAAELQMREAARHAIARVQVVAALQAVLDALPVQMDALVDRLLPVRREHRPEEVDTRQHRRVVQLVREIDAELREAVALVVQLERTDDEGSKRAVRPRGQRRVAVL